MMLNMNDEVVKPADLNRVFLLPGELCVSHEPMFIATLLGSCIAVCIYNPKTGSAGMNHFLRDCMPNQEESAGKFGDASITYLVKTLTALDGKGSRFEAKIFGGGAVVGDLALGSGIGAANILIARKILRQFRIPIVEEDVGGKQGMKIYFNTKTFEVETRHMRARYKDFTDRKMRVLIVDDSELIRKILRKDIESSSERSILGAPGRRPPASSRSRQPFREPSPSATSTQGAGVEAGSTVLSSALIPRSRARVP